MKGPIKLMIADDHQVLLDGLQMMLSNVPDLDIVAVASNGEDVLVKMHSYYVDVLLMDIQMPYKDGFETAAEIVQKYPDTRILILSMHSEKVVIERIFKAGASGYLLKTAGRDEIITAIRKVARGEKYFSAEVTMAVLNDDPGINQITNAELTKREKEILVMIASGMNNPAIADKLFLSVDTVKSHRKNLMRKLDVNNTAALVAYAIKHFNS